MIGWNYEDILIPNEINIKYILSSLILYTSTGLVPMHILILDDKPTVTKGIGFTLIALGHSVEECFNPIIGLLKIQIEVPGR
jgi:hypothetical protein